MAVEKHAKRIPTKRHKNEDLGHHESCLEPKTSRLVDSMLFLSKIISNEEGKRQI